MAGDYKCVASNRAGQSQARFTVVILCMHLSSTHCRELELRIQKPGREQSKKAHQLLIPLPALKAQSQRPLFAEYSNSDNLMLLPTTSVKNAVPLSRASQQSPLPFHSYRSATKQPHLSISTRTHSTSTASSPPLQHTHFMQWSPIYENPSVLHLPSSNPNQFDENLNHSPQWEPVQISLLDLPHPSIIGPRISPNYNVDKRRIYYHLDGHSTSKSGSSAKTDANALHAWVYAPAVVTSGPPTLLLRNNRSSMGSPVRVGSVRAKMRTLLRRSSSSIGDTHPRNRISLRQRKMAQHSHVISRHRVQSQNRSISNKTHKHSKVYGSAQKIQRTHSLPRRTEQLLQSLANF